MKHPHTPCKILCRQYHMRKYLWETRSSAEPNINESHSCCEETFHIIFTFLQRRWGFFVRSTWGKKLLKNHENCRIIHCGFQRSTKSYIVDLMPKMKNIIGERYDKSRVNPDSYLYSNTGIPLHIYTPDSATKLRQHRNGMEKSRYHDFSSWWPLYSCKELPLR